MAVLFSQALVLLRFIRPVAKRSWGAGHRPGSNALLLSTSIESFFEYFGGLGDPVSILIDPVWVPIEPLYWVIKNRFIFGNRFTVNRFGMIGFSLNRFILNPFEDGIQ